MILGITGRARTGKDTFATMLGEASGRVVKRIQIAGPLKAYLRDLFDWTEEHTDGDLKDVPDERYPVTCQGCRGGGKVPYSAQFNDPPFNKQTDCQHCGATGHIGLTPRHAMQQLGGEFAEATFPAIYALRAAREAEAHRGVALITDCRFLRDIEAVEAVGGIIIEVLRPEDLVEAKVLTHASETARLQPSFQAIVDEHIINDGTLDELRVKAEAIIAKYQTAAEAPLPIKPGDWMESKRFGPCVCIEDRDDHYTLRYEAIHNLSGRTIWVGNGEPKANCTFLRAADEESKHVLTLTGPYGEGPVEPTKG